uniref:Neurotransmitter-gated ion-channel ligand-binding domain-containing protein n=1 Tax=Ditylenchus dipsaci TaxID=166011 RepID=A0A915D859_9BILA
MLLTQSNIDCEVQKNISDIKKVSIEELEMLENCVFNFLMHKEAEMSSSGGLNTLASNPPWLFPIKVTVDHFIIHQIDSLAKASAEFNIHGDLFISWNDSRLMWNETEWKIDSFELHENQQVWIPTFADESTCGIAEGCISKISDVELHNTGKVTARLTFRYPSFCKLNFYRYPEETNDCYLYLSVSNTERVVKYDIQTKQRAFLTKPVAISKIDTDRITTTLTNVETSVWVIQDLSIDIVKIDGFRSDFLQLSAKAKKEMSTLRIALSLPVTIATMVMLVSPLFGDLKTQACVKLLTLTLQTICFLFLCSIAPTNGFAGSKPKIYTFYEFLFFLTFLSILVTLVCLALCRLKRNVPASHNLYLAAKVINHFLCCIEPDPATNYQRHLEDSGFDTMSNSGLRNCAPGMNGPHDHSNSNSLANDYTMEWRHIFIAVNNLFSGVSFSIFCFVIIFGVM